MPITEVLKSFFRFTGNLSIESDKNHDCMTIN